jgi:hypothetical protein
MQEDRATVLLKAVLEILNKCDQGPYVKDVFEQTAFYDEADCDGYCLRYDISIHLEENLPDV